MLKSRNFLCTQKAWRNFVYKLSFTDKKIESNNNERDEFPNFKPS